MEAAWRWRPWTNVLENKELREQVGCGATTAALDSSYVTYCPEEKEEILNHLKDIAVCEQHKVKPNLQPYYQCRVV